MSVEQAIEYIEREYGNVLAYAGRHDWTEGRPLTFNDVATVRWLIREVEHLRDDNGHLAQFVIQKCDKCGLVTAPIVEEAPEGIEWR